MSPGKTIFNQRQLLRFWLPLAASWGLMGAEGPILQAAIARLPDIQVQLAAFGIVLNLEIAIESPVIMLLATSTALTTSGRNYRTMRRFTLAVAALATLAALLMAYTPLYGAIVRQLMGIPANIASAAQPGMKIMVFWSAAIGIRRFYQGVLIRHNQTRWIGWGTAVRLLFSGGSGITLALLTELPGVHIGAAALMAGVVSEAAFIAVAVRSTVRHVLRLDGSDPDTVSFGAITRYHTPLAATSLLTLLAQPIISAGLARMPYPVENLAAWPIVWGILFLFRSPAFALPEAIIALVSGAHLEQVLRSFCLRVGSASSAAMLAFAVTPSLPWYLKHIAGLPYDLARYVAPGLLLTIPLPFVNCIHSWYRGLLMAERNTRTIYWGMGLNLVVTGLLVALGALLRLPGCETAAVTLTASFIAEIYYLRTRLLPQSSRTQVHT